MNKVVRVAEMLKTDEEFLSTARGVELACDRIKRGNSLHSLRMLWFWLVLLVFDVASSVWYLLVPTAIVFIAFHLWLLMWEYERDNQRMDSTVESIWKTTLFIIRSRAREEQA